MTYPIFYPVNLVKFHSDMKENYYIVIPLISFGALVVLMLFGMLVYRCLSEYLFCQYISYIPDNAIIESSVTNGRVVYNRAAETCRVDARPSLTNTSEYLPLYRSRLPAFPKVNLPYFRNSDVRKRFIVIDGSTVFPEFKFSPKHLEICLQYFVDMGHNAIAVVSSDLDFGGEIMKRLMKWNLITIAPMNDRILQWPAPFNHLMMFLIADAKNGVIISNADFTTVVKNCMARYPRWVQIKERVVGVKWLEDQIIMPEYPCGADQPSFREILSQ